VNVDIACQVGKLVGLVPRVQVSPVSGRWLRSLLITGGTPYLLQQVPVLHKCNPHRVTSAARLLHLASRISRLVGQRGAPKAPGQAWEWSMLRLLSAAHSWPAGRRAFSLLLLRPVPCVVLEPPLPVRSMRVDGLVSPPVGKFKPQLLPEPLAAEQFVWSRRAQIANCMRRVCFCQVQQKSCGRDKLCLGALTHPSHPGAVTEGFQSTLRCGMRSKGGRTMKVPSGEEAGPQALRIVPHHHTLAVSTPSVPFPTVLPCVQPIRLQNGRARRAIPRAFVSLTPPRWGCWKTLLRARFRAVRGLAGCFAPSLRYPATVAEMSSGSTGASLSKQTDYAVLPSRHCCHQGGRYGIGESHCELTGN